MKRRLLLAALLLPAAALLAPPAPPAASEAREDSVGPADAHLTGADIYRRVVDNRFRSAKQEMTLTSGDRGKNEQQMRLEMTWQDWRGADDKAVDGYYSKTLVVYTDPFDVRYTAYLVMQKEQPPNDQFVYLPSRRKVRRVNLRNETVFGTDFSFEDVIPREFENATYRRLPDEVVDGILCYVVESTPKPEQNSEYSKFLLYVEKAHAVPLRVRYWSENGVEVKELVSPAESIQEFDGIYEPMRATMRTIVQDTYTLAVVEKLTPNPELPRATFDPRKLEGH